MTRYKSHPFSPKARRPRRRAPSAFKKTRRWGSPDRSDPEFRLHWLAGLGILFSVLQAVICGFEVAESKSFWFSIGVIFFAGKALFYWQRPTRIPPMRQAFQSGVGLASILCFFIGEISVFYMLKHFLPYVEMPVSAFLYGLEFYMLYVLGRASFRKWLVYRHGKRQDKYLAELAGKAALDAVKQKRITVEEALRRHAKERKDLERASGAYELLPLSGRGIGKMPKGIQPLPATSWQALGQDLSEVRSRISGLWRRRRPETLQTSSGQ